MYELNLKKKKQKKMNQQKTTNKAMRLCGLQAFKYIASLRSDTEYNKCGYLWV